MSSDTINRKYHGKEFYGGDFLGWVYKFDVETFFDTPVYYINDDSVVWGCRDESVSLTQSSLALRKTRILATRRIL